MSDIVPLYNITKHDGIIDGVDDRVRGTFIVIGEVHCRKASSSDVEPEQVFCGVLAPEREHLQEGEWLHLDMDISAGQHGGEFG